jgi:hypothetical protein
MGSLGGLTADGASCPGRLPIDPRPSWIAPTTSHPWVRCRRPPPLASHRPQLAFYSQRPPKGLKRGAVLRWSNPRYHL